MGSCVEPGPLLGSVHGTGSQVVLYLRSGAAAAMESRAWRSGGASPTDGISTAPGLRRRGRGTTTRLGVAGREEDQRHRWDSPVGMGVTGRGRRAAWRRQAHGQRNASRPR
nr:unnamed protein product [Digitaria exilis]